MNYNHWQSISLLLVLFALVGCGGTAGSSSEKIDPHLSLLTKLFVDHLNSHQGMPPRDENAFKEFICAQGESRLDRSQLENLDKLFISTRDGQPLVMFYGHANDARLQGSVVGHEQEGIGGKRCVGMRYGTVELADADEFAQLMP